MDNLTDQLKAANGEEAGLNLELIVIQKASLNRRIDDDGVVAPLSGKFGLSIEAGGRLSVKTSPKNKKRYVVAILNVVANAGSEANESGSDVECEITLQGFFSTKSDHSQDQLNHLITNNKYLYHDLVKGLYPVAARQIRHMLVDAGVPAPPMNYSFRLDELTTSEGTE